ncbi:hypothetical protein H2248_002331 [Termitomyces sp. 'cryptogamus']|nr:hypothetical protein H2248_002331 [Termitomyces sp. 'cryptogamus']
MTSTLEIHPTYGHESCLRPPHPRKLSNDLSAPAPLILPLQPEDPPTPALSSSSSDLTLRTTINFEYPDLKYSCIRTNGRVFTTVIIQTPSNTNVGIVGGSSSSSPLA